MIFLEFFLLIIELNLFTLYASQSASSASDTVTGTADEIKDGAADEIMAGAADEIMAGAAGNSTDGELEETATASELKSADRTLGESADGAADDGISE